MCRFASGIEALAADPTSALVTGQLAALHLQRAREGGGWDDYLTAEALCAPVTRRAHATQRGHRLDAGFDPARAAPLCRSTRDR